MRGFDQFVRCESQVIGRLIDTIRRDSMPLLGDGHVAGYIPQLAILYAKELCADRIIWD